MRISIFLISLSFIIFIPSSYQIYAGSSSMAMGLVISISMFVFLYLCKFKKIIKFDEYLLNILIFFTLIFLTSIYSIIFFNSFEVKKFFISFFLIGIVVIGAFYFVNLSIKINNEKFHSYINIIFYILLLDGIKKVVDRFIFLDKSKEFIFFSEPSHFGLIYLIFLSYKILTSERNIYIYTNILLSLIFAITFPNLIILVGTVIVSSIYSIKKTLILILIKFFVLFIFVDPVYFSYFTDRITMQSENLSSLVFLSGWERAYLHLFQSNFFGIGFQQLGYIEIDSFFQNKLAALNLPRINIHDGGSTAPKIVAEFGLLGIFLIIMYIFYFIKYFTKIKKHKLFCNNIDKFYISVFLLSSVNLFLRGMGYFSPIMFLFLCSIIYFNYKKFNGL